MLHRIDHPLLQAKLAVLRDRATPPHLFRRTVREIAALMVPAVTADFDTETVPCPTPLEITSGHRLARPVVLAPVLRAGLGMLDGFLDMLPEAAVAHVGLARDEQTLEACSYYFNSPRSLEGLEVIVVDPMLATGGSAIAAVRRLRERGATRLRLACLVAAPEGVAAVVQQCPELPVYTVALDRCLNERGYILPGLGDAGDRIFGT
jgi:uracil phosphoribosyltransferase